MRDQSRKKRSYRWTAAFIIVSIFVLFAGSVTMRHVSGHAAEANEGCVVSMMQGFCFGSGPMSSSHGKTHIRALQNIFVGFFQKESTVLGAMFFALVVLFLAVSWALREQTIITWFRAWVRQKMPCRSSLANFYSRYWIHLFEKRDPIVIAAGA